MLLLTFTSPEVVIALMSYKLSKTNRKVFMTCNERRKIPGACLNNIIESY
jgi:hypothetical protein